MKPRCALRRAFAYMLAVICLLSSRMLLEKQGFTAVLHYSGDNAPAFKQAQTFIEQNQDGSGSGLISIAAWAQGAIGQISTIGTRTVSVDCFYVIGDASRLFPEMICGSMPSLGQKGTAVDEATAEKLFGSIEVVGNPMMLDGEPYTICGVFACPKGIPAWGSSPARGLAVLSPRMDAKLQSLGLLLPPSPEETIQRATALTHSMGGADSIEDRNLTALFIRQIGWLPLWIWAIAAFARPGKTVWSYIRRSAKHDVPTSTGLQRAYDIGLRILILAAFSLVCYGLLRLVEFAPRFPVSWLPTRWSNFSHWSSLINRLGEDWATAHAAPTLRSELPRLTLTGCMVIACVLSPLAWRRDSSKPSIIKLLGVALLPFPALLIAYLLGFELVFIPALVLLPVFVASMQYADELLN